jgi:hypothetical protein
MSVQIRSGGSTDVAHVNTDNELLVALSKVLANAGYAVMAGEVSDAGGSGGKLLRPVDVSIDQRLRVGMDNLVWDDTFNHAQFNVSKYAGLSSTATIVQSGNAMVLNAGNSVALNAACSFRTWRSFPVLGRFHINSAFAFSLSQPPVANNVVDIGFGVPNATAPYAPTDGVYMRITAGGVLQLVINVNGSETTAASALALDANTAYEARIVTDANRVELYIDDKLEASINQPVNSHVTVNPSVPLFARCHNTAATATAQNLRLMRWSVLVGDGNIMRLWSTVMGGMGNNCVNVPDGVAAGGTSNYANSAAPTSGTLSNTAAAFTTLGGQFQFAAIAGAETDYALFGYQVPAFAGAGGPPGKNLMIRGVRIETFNMGAAVAGTPTLLQWAIGVGATAVSLATADSASAATRAARRLPLGVQSMPIGSPIGYAAVPIDVNFDAPLMVDPGTWLHIILKMPVGTATASQIIRGTAMLNAYFE